MRKFLVATAITALAVLSTNYTAEAAFKIRLTHVESATSVTITDGGVGDANPAAGAVTFIGSVGVFNINVSTGLSKPVLPSSPISALMDLNSVNTSTAAGTLLIELTDTDFPGMLLGGHLQGDVGGTTQGSAEFSAYVNASNAEFDTVGAAAEVHLGPFSPVAFSGSASDSFGPIGDYSMTIVAKIIHGSGINSTSFNFQVGTTAVPAPAGLLIALTGLPMLGVGAWVRRRKTTVAA
jgi:hypothetical protein